jgi:two-component system nitrogen regulation sensor histidine kinase NtrY
LLAFVAVAAVPLALYAVLGFRATRLELEEATRGAAAEALGAASRILVGDDALADGTTGALTASLREIATVLQQDFILYWRGRTVASSRPEIFASRLFADRMEGEVYTDLLAVRQPIVFDSMTLGGRSFLVAYRALAEPDAPSGYVLATPLLIREDRARVDLQRLGEGVFLLSAFSLGFLLIVGWGLARYMARPLSALEKGTLQIAAGRLSYRLPSPARRDEFGRLQRAFNAMAARLDSGQSALEREKSRVQAILASVGAGVVAIDEAGRVRLLNGRAGALLGQRSEEVLDRAVAELAAGDGPAAAFWRAVEGELAGAPADHDLVLRRDGGDRHYTVVCTGLRDGAGEERGLVVAFEDITANVQSQRVLAWGEMARQVAHEIKNPLTPMKLSLQHLERAVEDGADNFEEVLHANIDLVLSEIERLENIAGNFARFAVPDPAVRAPFDAPAVAGEVLALFAPGEEGVAYDLEVAGTPRPLLGDPEGFRRILVNLIQNSREAVLAVGGGRVVLRLDWLREAGWTWISVVDDGVGLPDKGLDRLFEPSFSTKTRGTGLGLAITRRIVEAWGGTIEYERRKGGTAIHVRLESPAPNEDH